MFRIGPEKVVYVRIDINTTRWSIIRNGASRAYDTRFDGGASSLPPDRRSSLPPDPIHPRGVSDERYLLGRFDATHDGAEPREFLVESFVPSIEMPQSLHAGGPVRDQTRQHQRGGRA